MVSKMARIRWPKEDSEVIIAVGVDGPVDEEGAAHDGFAVDKAPVAAVGAVVAIIAHGEIFSWRHDQFVALYVFADFVGPLHLNGPG